MDVSFKVHGILPMRDSLQMALHVLAQAVRSRNSRCIASNIYVLSQNVPDVCCRFQNFSDVCYNAVFFSYHRFFSTLFVDVKVIYQGYVLTWTFIQIFVTDEVWFLNVDTTRPQILPLNPIKSHCIS